MRGGHGTNLSQLLVGERVLEGLLLFFRRPRRLPASDGGGGRLLGRC